MLRTMLSGERVARRKWTFLLIDKWFFGDSRYVSAVRLWVLIAAYSEEAT